MWDTINLKSGDFGTATLDLSRAQQQSPFTVDAGLTNRAVGGLKTAAQLQRALTLQFPDQGGGVHNFKDGSEAKRVGDDFELKARNGQRYQLHFSETGVVVSHLGQSVARSGESVYLGLNGLRVGSMPSNAKDVADLFSTTAASNPSATTPTVAPVVDPELNASLTTFNDLLPKQTAPVQAAGENFASTVKNNVANQANASDLARATSNFVNAVLPEKSSANYRTIDEAMVGTGKEIDNLEKELIELRKKKPTAEINARMQELQSQMQLLAQAARILAQAARAKAQMFA